MGRTQVYLGDEELALLERAAQASGASRSELIRRAIQRTFGASGREDRLRALEASAGSWGGRGPMGAEYVNEVRGDLGERLRRLGLDD